MLQYSQPLAYPQHLVDTQYMSVEGMNHLFLSSLSATAFVLIIAYLDQCDNLTTLPPALL